MPQEAFFWGGFIFKFSIKKRITMDQKIPVQRHLIKHNSAVEAAIFEWRSPTRLPRKSMTNFVRHLAKRSNSLQEDLSLICLHAIIPGFERNPWNQKPTSRMWR